MLKNSLGRRVLAAFGGVLMLAGAGTTGTALAGTDFRATLTGGNVPGGGDRDGWGGLRIEIMDRNTNRLCADLEIRSIAEVTSAQIYRGREGEVGEPVARLERPRDDDSFDCKEIGADLAQEIQSNPSAFYASVATTEYPNGAIRGQLGPAG
ncbi:MAG TPA: CHRD domain-containing protein [Allosphingosinicella sp.]|nr:CHRD domain-containing protein [Allosphingosinicella sp.]